MKAALTTALGLVLLAPAAAADFITGRVVDWNGVGVEGVDIDVKEENTGQQPPIFNDGTNANGFFNTTLPPGVYTVTFTPPKPPATTHLITEVEGVVVFGTTNMGVITLPRGVSLSGRTIDTNQIPVQNVDIDVIDPATGNEIELQGDNTTALGLFNIAVPLVPIEVEFHTKNVLGPTLAPIAMDFSLTSNTELGDVTLLPGFTVTGRVQDSTGQVVQGADVDVVDPVTREEQFTPGDNTNANGDFSVVVRAGTFDLEICAQAAQLLVATTLENLVIAGNVGVGTSTLGPGVVLSGTVLDSKGNPAAKVDVDVADSVSGQAVTLCGDRTNALGAYSVIVPNGTLDVDFERRCRGGGPMRRDVHLGVLVSGATVLNGQLPGCPRPPRRFAGPPSSLGSVSRSAPLSVGEPAPGGDASLLPTSMTYGAGVAGAGGRVPRLSLSRTESGFALELGNAAGGATALLVAGPRPGSTHRAHGSILVEPVHGRVRLVTLDGAPGVPGAGSASLPMTELEELAGYWQLVVLDPAAPGGVALSEGLRIDAD